MIIHYQCPECDNEITGELTLERARAICDNCGKESKIPFDGIKPGMILGNGYRIIKRLDEQSTAKHYLAYQESMEREVTLKVLPSDYGDDEEEFLRFKREIKLAASLNHPNILSAFGAGQDAGILFLIRQYKEGETLEEYCLRNERMDERKLLKCMLPIADALGNAWKKEKLLHRNLKPENVLLCENDVAMLADLGIAKSMKKSVEVDITSAGFTVGTPEYMSPEQVQAKQDLDCRSDIYSFCTLLYRMVTGEVPFADPSPLTVMQKQMNEIPTPAQFKNSEVSTKVSAMLDKGLKKDPAERFQSWDELIATMKGILKNDGTGKKSGGGKIGGNSSHNLRRKRPRPKSGSLKRAADTPSSDVRRESEEWIDDDLPVAETDRAKIALYVLAILIPLFVAIAYIYLRHR